jgi:hypothetical protein
VNKVDQEASGRYLRHPVFISLDDYHFTWQIDSILNEEVNHAPTFPAQDAHLLSHGKERRHREVFGYLIDLSPDGMKMLSDKEIEVEKYYRLTIDVKATGLRPRTAVEAKSAWCRPDVNPTSMPPARL